ncbi:MAG: BON domain-containing protein [Bryobacterales bacterium]|nr:BON domain-containing protein [Bryobacterales bacterium]
MKLLLCLLSIVAALAQPHSRPPSAPPAHKRAAAPAPKYTDAQIQANIQTRLSKSKIGKNGFKFTTANGITTIEGKANVIQHKGAATRMAKAAGARAVVNKIEISEAAKNAARAKLESGRRRVQVKRGEVRSQAR